MLAPGRLRRIRFKTVARTPTNESKNESERTRWVLSILFSVVVVCFWLGCVLCVLCLFVVTFVVLFLFFVVCFWLGCVSFVLCLLLVLLVVFRYIFLLVVFSLFLL